MDILEGEVRVRTHVVCPEGGELPSDKVLQHMLLVPPDMVQTYGYALTQVVEGNMNPLTAVHYAKLAPDPDEEETDDASGAHT